MTQIYHGGKMTTTANRRSTDGDIGFLQARVEDIAKNGVDTASQLSKHVSECAAMQKKVLIGVISLGIWSVTHSPEAFAIFGRVAKVLAPAALP